MHVCMYVCSLTSPGIWHVSNDISFPNNSVHVARTSLQTSIDGGKKLGQTM
jgi:hypothetical protein